MKSIIVTGTVEEIREGLSVERVQREALAAFGEFACFDSSGASR